MPATPTEGPGSVPPGHRSRGRHVLRRIVTAAIALAAFYGLLLLGLYAAQRSLIYHPLPLERADWTPSFPAQLVELEAADGTSLGALYSEPPGEERPVVLITHGNAGNVRTWADLLALYRAHGYGGLLLDPRGYGMSGGTPDEQGCVMDARAALDWLVARGIPARRVVLHGVSIGAGMVVPLARERPVCGMILQSAFTDLVSVARRVFFFVPCGLLLKDRYDNLAQAPDVDVPVLLLHGREDHLVPASHSLRLARAFPEVRDLVVVPGHGHNDLALWEGYWRTLERFLRDL